MPAALAARGWGPTASEALILEVVDEYLPHNSGIYRVTSDGVVRVAESAADLTCTVNQLSMLYFGDRSPSQLAGAELIEVHDPRALPTADRLFAVDVAPWGGSMF